MKSKLIILNFDQIKIIVYKERCAKFYFGNLRIKSNSTHSCREMKRFVYKNDLAIFATH